jgi:hypothetical protein
LECGGDGPGQRGRAVDGDGDGGRQRAVLSVGEPGGAISVAINHSNKTIMKENKPASPVVGTSKQQSGGKKPYRKPGLKRLGMLQSVAGSGINFGNSRGKKV